jgi:pilus assembly protein CpaB
MAEPQKTLKTLLIAVGAGLLAAALSYLYLENKKKQLIASFAGPADEVISVVVSAKDLGKGTILDESMLQLLEMPSRFVPDGVLTSDNYTKFLGRSISRNLQQGKPISSPDLEYLARDFSDVIKKERRGLTVSVDDLNSISGMMRPGNFIDIFVLVDPLKLGENQPKPGIKNIILPVLQDVQVLATGKDAYQSYLDQYYLPQGRSTDSFNNITLDVSPKEAALLSIAIDQGDLVAVLRNRDDRSMGDFSILSGADLVSAAIEAQRKAKLLAAAKASGATIDKDGNWVTADGKVISKDDIVISANGIVITKSGEILGSKNLKVDKDGNFVDKNGNVIAKDDVVVRPDGSIVSKDQIMKEAGYTKNENGDYVDKDGNIIKAGDVKVNADGSIVTEDGRVLGTPDTVVMQNGSVKSKDQIMKEAGYTKNENGDYVDKDGNIVKADDVKLLANGSIITKDGKTLSGPEVKVNASGCLIGEDGSVMTADGQLLQGVAVDEDDNVYGPDGKLITDCNLTVSSDGTVRDSSGNIVSEVTSEPLGTDDFSSEQLLDYVKENKVFSIKLILGGESEDGKAKTVDLPVETLLQKQKSSGE